MADTAASTASTANNDAAAETSAFEVALQRYHQGAAASDLIGDFEAIVVQNPRQSAGWICLAWLQLLDNQPLDALRSARTAVRLSPQDPQARINLALAMLETGAKGVREHIEVVQRVLLMAPDMASEIQESIADGLQRRPGWGSMAKVKAWLEG